MEIYFNQIRRRTFTDEMSRNTRHIEHIYDELKRICSGMDYWIWQYNGLREQYAGLNNDLTSLILAMRRHVTFLEKSADRYIRADANLERIAEEELNELTGVTARIVPMSPTVTPPFQIQDIQMSTLPSGFLGSVVQWSPESLNPLPVTATVVESGVLASVATAGQSMLSVAMLDGNAQNNAQYVCGVLSSVDKDIFNESQPRTESEVVDFLSARGTEFGWFQMEPDDAWEMAQDGFPMLMTYEGVAAVAVPNGTEQLCARSADGVLNKTLFDVRNYQESDLKLYVHQSV